MLCALCAYNLQISSTQPRSKGNKEINGWGYSDNISSIQACDRRVHYSLNKCVTSPNVVYRCDKALRIGMWYQAETGGQETKKASIRNSKERDNVS